MTGAKEGVKSGTRTTGISSLSTDLEVGLPLFERMLLIRTFEQRVARLYSDGEVPGFVHLSVGQEAVAVGACWPLQDDDVITSTHRGHGHCLAKGVDPESMMAELMGRATGTNRGRGGSMHIADPRKGVYGANGIVAAGIPIAVGAATASQIRGRHSVVVSFFGDGAVSHGAFHEAVNLAAVWKLPVIFLCENNGFAEFSHTAAQHPAGMEARAAGYGLPYRYVDGNDVEAVAVTLDELVGAIRAGAGPMVVEAATYRWHGHYEGDPQSYRDSDELARRKVEEDPLVIQRARLIERGASGETLQRLEKAVADRIEHAIELARAAPEPDPSELESYVYRAPVPGGRKRNVPAEDSGDIPQGDRSVFRVMDAIHEAMSGALESDENVFVAGIDVGDGGNVFGLLRGLKARWPDRVLDTPISETAILGVGVGSAMAGMRPVVEIMYLDFIGVCFDQILNQAAKLPYMTGGRAPMGLTIRTQFGVGRSSGSQHSQSLEALLAHIPGLKVVMPSDPADTYGLLRTSILDPDPVVFIENRLLYGRKGPRPHPDHLVPIGVARVVRPGTDVTVVAWSYMVWEAVAAADLLATEGVSVEVVDLRTVAPLDFETIKASVSKTGRLLVAQQAVLRHGLGAEIAAQAASESFWDLDLPIARLGGPFTPVPYSPVLERAWTPDRQAIASAVRHMVRA